MLRPCLTSSKWAGDSKIINHIQSGPFIYSGFHLVLYKFVIRLRPRPPAASPQERSWGLRPQDPPWGSAPNPARGSAPDPLLNVWGRSPQLHSCGEAAGVWGGAPAGSGGGAPASLLRRSRRGLELSPSGGLGAQPPATFLRRSRPGVWGRDPNCRGPLPLPPFSATPLLIPNGTGGSFQM